MSLIVLLTAENYQEYALWRFRGNNGYTKPPQHYVKLTSPILLFSPVSTLILQTVTYQDYVLPKLCMYKVVQIWPGQTVTCLHTNRPGHIWTTLYFVFLMRCSLTPPPDFSVLCLNILTVRMSPVNYIDSASEPRASAVGSPASFTRVGVRTSALRSAVFSEISSHILLLL